VPWLPGSTDRPGVVLLPFGLGYTAEEQEQLILVAAKVLYYFKQAAAPSE
jgi:hypothetical protein